MCYGHVCGAGFSQSTRIRNNYDLRQTKPEIGMSFSLQATLTGQNYEVKELNLQHITQQCFFYHVLL